MCTPAAGAVWTVPPEWTGHGTNLIVRRKALRLPQFAITASSVFPSCCIFGSWLQGVVATTSSHPTNPPWRNVTDNHPTCQCLPVRVQFGFVAHSLREEIN